MVLIERRPIHARAIGYEACVWIGLFPKVTEGALLEVVNESVVGACRSAPQMHDQNNERGEAKVANSALPLDDLKLCFDHILRVCANHHAKLARLDHKTHLAVPKRKLIVRQRKLD